MATYKDSGVDVDLGDRCSKIAYQAAKETFSGRQGMLGQPVVQEGGFTGLLDMGEFYLIQNDDGVGTKMEVAERLQKFDTLGYDLIAMVADDGICVGAEIISVTNTLDSPYLNQTMVEALMKGLKKAALEEKIVVPGGELAELGDALNGAVWNATAVGVVEKNKVIDGSTIEAGDVIIALASDGIRSNGLSLARMILKEEFGEEWHTAEYKPGQNWGEVILIPSKIYHRKLLNLLGAHKQERKVNVKGLVHNTGGGIPGNLPRLLKSKNLGAQLDELLPAHDFMLNLQTLGKVSDEEAYKTWNMGMGMFLVLNAEDADQALELLNKEGLSSQVIGRVTKDEKIRLLSQGAMNKGEELVF